MRPAGLAVNETDAQAAQSRLPTENIMSVRFQCTQTVTAMVMKHGTAHFVFAPIEVSNRLGWLSASNSARAPDGAA
jgi:hypothetical protein